MMLGIDLKNKKWIIYLSLFLFRIFIREFGNVLLIAISPKSLDSNLTGLSMFQDKPYLMPLL